MNTVHPTTACLSAGALLLAVMLTAAAPYVSARDARFDFEFCFSAQTTTLKHGDDGVAFSWGNMAGVATSHIDNSLFDRAWFQCVGNASVIRGVLSVSDSCKFADHDGDTFSATIRRVNDRTTGEDTENRFSIFAGSGKYAGITGTGTIANSYLFPEDVPDFFVGCDRMQGSYRLP